MKLGHLLFFAVTIYSIFNGSTCHKRKEPGYLFIHPKAVTSTQNETVCISVYDAVTPFRISVDLKVKERHFIKTYVINNAHDCFEFTIPKLRFRAKDVHYASFHLQIDLNNTVYTAHSVGPVLIFPYNDIYFIETDRSYYKPGDIVKIRILVLNQDLKPPENVKIPLIKLRNPSGIAVNVWDNVVLKSGLSQIEHQLPSETTQGKWKIEINDITKTFAVKEYILPRFKVILKNPRRIYSDWQNAEFEVCGKYSYGKEVKGSALLKINFNFFEREPITQIKRLENGCGKFFFTKNDLHFHEQVHSHLSLTAVITEEDTNRAEITVGKSNIVNEAYKLKFSTDTKFFQPGFPYKGRLIASNALIDLRTEVVEICYIVAKNFAWNIQNTKQCSQFMFDDNGGIDFTIPPLRDNIIRVDLQGESLNQSIKEEWPTHSGQSYPNRFSSKITTYSSITRWYSPSRSYLVLKPTGKDQFHCQSVQEYVVQYSSNLIHAGESIYFHFIIKSHSKIFQSGRLIHKSNKQQGIQFSDFKNIIGSNHSFVKANNFIDKFSFKLSLGSEVLSKAQLLLYFVLNNTETVAASVDVNVEKCLPNKVEAKWSKSDFRPGEEAKLTLKSSSDSLCAISAIDKSSITLSTSKPLTVNSILAPFLQEKDSKQSEVLNCIPRNVRKPLGVVRNNLGASHSARSKRSSTRTFYSSQYDSFEAFDGVGVGYITNLNVLSKQCEEDAPSELNSSVSNTRVNLLEARNYQYDVVNLDEEISRRFLFPETWLWELVALDGREEKEISQFLPHSLTNWVCNVLCVSPMNGIGVSPSFELTVFQPFFLEVLAPRTIKRNEILHLQTIVFNYLNYSLPLRITLENSTNFDLVEYPANSGFIYCISANESKTFVFRIKSSILGTVNVTVSAEVEASYPGRCGPDVIINKRDEVLKTVVVEPEGYTTEKTNSVVLCGKDSSVPNNVTWVLTLPYNYIRDSENAVLTLDAELMGPTIRNLEKLITVPSGCGEQLVAAIAPNLYVLRYLNATGKLTNPIRHRIMRNLKIGYQRILSYIHDDGSFSAFGYYDSIGSMFLTSFVVRTLAQLRQHVYVDQSVIDKAVKWILMNQLENGCFNAVSHVFHDMGGTSSENSTSALTSYVVISILESGFELKDKVVNDATYCIRADYSPDKYTLAISSYALALINKNGATAALQKLLEMATTENNVMWWSSTESVSANIEMTSYALMALLHHGGADNLVHAHSVVRWLLAQRQSHGGFVTSQDTAVALDAISRYMALVKGKSANLSVYVVTNDTVQDITIRNKDKLKTKQIVLSTFPNLVKIIVNGDGCILASSSVSYNLEYLIKSETFKLAVDVQSVSSADKCSIAMVSPCLAYKLPDVKSNMAVLEVKMPTGYEPDRASLYKLQETNTKVKRFEETENEVVLYFTKLSNEPVCVPFTINENSIVDSRVDAVVKLYDYYNPELQTATAYHVNSCKSSDFGQLPNFSANISSSTVLVSDLSRDSFPSETFSKTATLYKTKFPNNSYFLEDN